jgi:hypothetical protein
MAKDKQEQKTETESLVDRLKKLPEGLKESQAKQELKWDGSDVEFREAFLTHYLKVSVKPKGKANGK